MIDAEKLVYDYLSAQPLSTRIVGHTPGDTSGTWITVQQLDARAVDDHRSDHFVDYLIQFSIYAGGRPELWTLALAARAALREMPGVHGDVVVTGVLLGSMRRLPDTDFKQAKERVILTADIYAHPA